MQFKTTINQPIEVVFQLITDLAHYDQWLPSSTLFNAVTTVSENPIRLGTTYVDKGRSSKLIGKVTEFQPPTRVAFREGTHVKLLVLEVGLDIQIQYALNAIDGSTEVTRTHTLSTAGMLKLLQPVIIRPIWKENERILQMMKAHLEGVHPKP